MEVRVFNDKMAVAEQFSEYFLELSSNGDDFHVALSGGSTPKIVFDVLREQYYDRIDWKKVHLYWGDERCVPPTDEQSNYKMTFDHLISGIEIPKKNIHRILGEDDPANEANRYSGVLSENLPSINGIPQFDLVILGMGDDGHTASVFPHQMHLWDSTNHCEVATHPESGQKRVTITGNVINQAREVVFLVTGASKTEKVKEIVNQLSESDRYPASKVAPLSGKLSWFLDAEAAKELTLA